MATKTGGFVSGDVLTAAQINEYLQQRNAWDSWTPTWTNLTVGNGTLVAKYNQVGRIVHWHLTFAFGSTSSVSGVITFTLPTAAARMNQHPMSGLAYDFTSNRWPLDLVWATTSSLQIFGTGTPCQATSSTVPFTWGTSDEFYVGGMYEAASAP